MEREALCRTGRALVSIAVSLQRYAKLSSGAGLNHHFGNEPAQQLLRASEVGQKFQGWQEYVSGCRCLKGARCSGESEIKNIGLINALIFQQLSAYVSSCTGGFFPPLKRADPACCFLQRMISLARKETPLT